MSFWLLQGERDGNADQVEGFALGAGGLGEHGHGGLGADKADLVAGQRGQVLEQAAEAAVGAPGRVVLGRGLGLGAGRAAGRGDGVFLPGRVLAGEGQRDTLPLPRRQHPDPVDRTGSRSQRLTSGKGTRSARCAERRTPGAGGDLRETDDGNTCTAPAGLPHCES